jgi:hypothetical protein
MPHLLPKTTLQPPPAEQKKHTTEVQKTKKKKKKKIAPKNGTKGGTKRKPEQVPPFRIYSHLSPVRLSVWSALSFI